MIAGRDVEMYAQQGTNVGPAGALRTGGNHTNGVPFIAVTATRHRAGSLDPEMEQLIGFDAAQITSGENRSNPRPGDPQPPLAASGSPRVAYALRADPAGVGQGHNTNYVPLGGEGVRDFTAEGADASEDGTGRGTPIVSFTESSGSDMRGGRGVSAVRRLTPV